MKAKLIHSWRLRPKPRMATKAEQLADNHARLSAEFDAIVTEALPDVQPLVYAHRESQQRWEDFQFAEGYTKAMHRCLSAVLFGIILLALVVGYSLLITY